MFKFLNQTSAPILGAQVYSDTSPASVADAGKRNTVDNISKIIGGLSSLGNAAANVIGATKGNPTNYGNFGGYGSPDSPIVLDAAEVPMPKQNLVNFGVNHEINMKPLLFIGAAIAAITLLKR